MGELTGKLQSIRRSMHETAGKYDGKRKCLLMACWKVFFIEKWKEIHSGKLEKRKRKEGEEKEEIKSRSNVEKKEVKEDRN